jgi:hypothetical protein
MHFIILSLISPTRFGSLPHHHQGLRISCCETKHAVISRCASSILISRTAFMFFTHSLQVLQHIQYICMMHGVNNVKTIRSVHSSTVALKIHLIITV